MRQILILSAAIASLAGLVTVTAPTPAEAQYYYGGYSYYRPYYSPRYYGGYYSDYYRYGPPGSRNALDTCSYC
jgi:hypothetical protein